MSDVFKPGEVAIWQNLTAPDDYANGQECFLISGMIWSDYVDRATHETGTGLFYRVRDSEGEWLAALWELRKNKPPETIIENRRFETEAV